MTTETRCGYVLADVRKSLVTAIERRDRRSALRWTAELVATPAAIGSLWAAYWVSWATAQSGPAVPIVIRQAWGEMMDTVDELEANWTTFRNDTEVRRQTCGLTLRLLSQPRPSPVVWPSKAIIKHDVTAMRDPVTVVPVATDGPVVLSVWQRIDDAMELRMMAGRFIASLEAGELRTSLSAVAWTLLPLAQQGLALPIKCAERGPPSLPAKIRASPLWFWLELGGAWIRHRSLHPGWFTMHEAITTAFRDHYKRWTPNDRMRMLLAWILQLRASCLPPTPDLWVPHATPVLSMPEIDFPYKEIAAELAAPETAIREAVKAKRAAAEKSVSEQKMEEADSMLMASLGLTDE